MTYRTAPVEPLLVSLGRGLLALDPSTGQIAWSVSTDAPITRLFRVGERALLVAGDKVVCVAIESGHVIGIVDLGFYPEEGVVCGTDLVLVHGKSLMPHRPAVVCLTSDGTIRWKATCELESKGFLDGEILFRSFAADGSRVSEARYPMTGEPGFLYRDLAVQPDRR